MRRYAESQDAFPKGAGDGPFFEHIEIEELHGIGQAREVERLQAAIWRANEAWIVPSHVLLIVADYGGILLGARTEGALVGFVLGFLASEGGRLYHASHMLGVLPALQHHGVGAALKRRQREAALAQGLALMRWTFDPLEAKNAYFNLRKLGATCRTYRPDYYGPMRDGLNRDLPSDRLIVEWRLHDAVPRAESALPALTILSNRDGIPDLRLEHLASGSAVAIEIPRDIQAIKRESPDSALAWRLATREAFSVAFRQGYEARDFRDGAYILVREGAVA